MHQITVVQRSDCPGTVAQLSPGCHIMHQITVVPRLQRRGGRGRITLLLSYHAPDHSGATGASRRPRPRLVMSCTGSRWCNQCVTLKGCTMRMCDTRVVISCTRSRWCNAVGERGRLGSDVVISCTRSRWCNMVTVEKGGAAGMVMSPSYHAPDHGGATTIPGHLGSNSRTLTVISCTRSRWCNCSEIRTPRPQDRGQGARLPMQPRS